MTTVAITKLPPAPPRPGLSFEQHVGVKLKYPVSADFQADGEIESPGISFEDYRRMGTVTHKLEANRRNPTPEWATDNRKLRDLIVRYTELRASFLNPRPGTDAERLERANKHVLLKRQKQIVILDGLCKEYVELKRLSAPSESEQQRKKSLEVLIEGLDTTIRTDERIPAVIAGIAFHYYRAGLNSVEVAAQMGIKPPHVRQLIWRLNQTWKRMQHSNYHYHLLTGKQVPHHVKKLEALAKNNCGLIPTYKWLRDNGYRQSYEVMCYFPAAFAHLKREKQLRKPYKPRKGNIDVIRVMEMRTKGLTYEQIGRALGYTGSAVLYSLQRAGLHKPVWHPPQRAPKPCGPKPRYQVDVHLVLKLIAEHKTNFQICEVLGLPDPVIFRRALRRAGVWQPRNRLTREG